MTHNTISLDYIHNNNNNNITQASTNNQHITHMLSCPSRQAARHSCP